MLYLLQHNFLFIMAKLQHLRISPNLLPWICGLELKFEWQTPAILIKLGSLIDPDAKRNLYWPLILYIVKNLRSPCLFVSLGWTWVWLQQQATARLRHHSPFWKTPILANYPRPAMHFVQEVSAAKNSLDSRQCRLLVAACQVTATSQGSRSWPKRAAQVVWGKDLWPPFLKRETPHCRQIFGAAAQTVPQSQQQKPNVKVIWSINFSLILDWRFKVSPGCQQWQLGPISCSRRAAAAQWLRAAPGSLLWSLCHLWIAWGFKISLLAPGGKRWPSSNIGSVLPKPVGKAQRMWFGSFWSRAFSNMSH